eukprot:749157-Hanusia_phi.AAC.2
MDQLYEYWSPTYPENEIGFQKKLRDMIQTYALCEADAPDKDKGDEMDDRDPPAEDEDKSVFQRAQDVLLNIEECTPEDMYEDWQCYFHQKREDWRAVTASAANIQELKAHLIKY